MLLKTRGIVLNQIPYNDNAVIASIYTEKSGRQSFWISGAKSTRSLRKSSLFQPLFLLEMEVMNVPRELKKIKEARNFPVYTSIPFDIHKTSMALFIAEVLSRSLPAEEPHQELFDFLWHSLITLDAEQEPVSNFHIYFILRLTRYLGFTPTDNYSPTCSYFDYHTGHFTEHPPLHQHYLEKNISCHLHFFLSSPYTHCMNYPLNAEMRVTILNKLLDYYDFHFDFPQKILSLKILKEVYHF